jgi:hypothetical protein
MGILQPADEADPNHGALAAHRERVNETSVRVRGPSAASAAQLHEPRRRHAAALDAV